MFEHSRLALSLQKGDTEMHRPRTQSPSGTTPAFRPSQSSLGGGSRSRPSLNSPNTTRNGLQEGHVGRAGSLDGTGATYGEGAGSGESGGGGDRDKQKKKPKKKGWKGWAMIYYDEDGNVVEERPRDETPPEERETVSPAAESQQSRERTAPVSASASEPVNMTGPFTDTNTNTIPTGTVIQQPIAVAPAPAVAESSSPLPESNPSIDRTSASLFCPFFTPLPTPPHNVRSSFGARTQPALTCATLIVFHVNHNADHRHFTSDTSPILEPYSFCACTMPPTPCRPIRSALLSNPYHHRRASSPLSDPPSPSSSLTASTSTAAVASTDPATHLETRRHIDRLPPKKRRKTSPSSTPQPDASRANSAAPRPAALKTKAPRSSHPTTAIGTSRTLALAAAKEKEAASSRATPVVHVVEDDTPLPKIPRVGMGAIYPIPAESDVRSEAMYIIESAKRSREEQEAREKESRSNGFHSHREALHRTPPPTRDRPPPIRAPPNGNGHLHDPSNQLPYCTPYTSGPYPSDPFDYPQPPIAGPSTSARRRESVVTPEDFETQFARIQESYDSASTIYIPRTTGLERPDDPKPPKFFPGQRPTVVLAPTAQANPAGRRGRDRFDRWERAHLDGFEGISDEHQENIRRFVENVRDNVVTLVDHYFPQAGPRRDAMLEATGRHLADFGWNLTDDAEAALQPRRDDEMDIYWAYARPEGRR